MSQREIDGVLAHDLDSAARIVYTSDSVHPRHGDNFRVFDPLEFFV